MEPLKKFVAMLGHELRNPLGTIAAALHVLREREGTLGRETSIIERQTQHLIRLVTDLLDVARISGGQIPLQRRSTNLETAIAHAVEIAGPLLTSRGHALSIDVAEELLLDADPERLAQVLANVLLNSATYTPKGGRIELIALRVGSDVRITIRDNGIGITRGQLPNVFEPFVQGRKSADRAEAGLGIGLSLARAIVDLHGGAIDVRSEGAGAGTEVEIRWPCATARQLRPSRPLRVLIVDDRSWVAEQFAEMLRSLGHEPHIVRDGESVRDVIERAEPEVALVHLGMSSFDCYELVQTLRTIPRAVTTTFVGLTTDDAPPDLERARMAGFARSVPRPLDLASLRMALDDTEGPAEP